MKILQHLPTPNFTTEDRLKIATYVLGHAGICFIVIALNLSADELPALLRLLFGIASFVFVIAVSVLAITRILEPLTFLILLGKPDIEQLSMIESINNNEEIK